MESGLITNIMEKANIVFLMDLLMMASGLKISMFIKSEGSNDYRYRMHGTGCFTNTSGAQFRGQFYNNSGPGLTAWLS
jgi:hypothetical protein